MFDEYRNHVSEGMEVNIVVDGFEMLNHCSTYKVMLLYELKYTWINVLD